MLTEKQEQVADFFGEKSNKMTIKGKKDLWKKNTLKNTVFFQRGNPELKGFTVFVVGAGPSLEKNVQELKRINRRGTIICVDAALRYVSQQGITPEYCICIDGSSLIKKMVQGIDTQGITLLCTPSASPQLIRAWKGERVFFSTGGNAEQVLKKWEETREVIALRDIKKGERIRPDNHFKVKFPGVAGDLGCGGNVTTVAHSLAVRMLQAMKVVFVGLDLSFQYDSHFYAGREHEANIAQRAAGEARFEHFDWLKKRVFTNFSLCSFKRWHEQHAQLSPGMAINATEGGILGIDEKGEREPFMEFMTLKEAIDKYASG